MNNPTQTVGPFTFMSVEEKCAYANILLQTKPRSMNFVVIHRKNLATGEDTTTSVRYDHFVETFFPGETLFADLYIQAYNLADFNINLKCAISAKDRDAAKTELATLMFRLEAAKKLFSLSDQEILQHSADARSKEFLHLRYPESSPVNRLDKALEEQEKQGE